MKVMRKYKSKEKPMLTETWNKTLVFLQDIGKQILVPLTQSLYVPGTLADNKHVIVDVGTGYYVEKVKTHTYKNTTYAPYFSE